MEGLGKGWWAHEHLPPPLTDHSIIEFLPPPLPDHSIIEFISDQLFRILAGSSLLDEASSPPELSPETTPPPPPSLPPPPPTPPPPPEDGHEWEKKKREEGGKSSLVHNIKAKRNTKLQRKKKLKTALGCVLSERKSRVARKNSCDLIQSNGPGRVSVITRSQSLFSKRMDDDTIVRLKRKAPIKKGQLTVASGRVPQASYLNANPAYLTRHYIKQWIQRSMLESEQLDENQAAAAKVEGRNNVSTGNRENSMKKVNRRRNLRKKVYTVKDYLNL